MSLRSLITLSLFRPASVAVARPVQPIPFRHQTLALSTSTPASDGAGQTATVVRKRTPPKPRVKKELPELIESELIESFVRGSGPGGQATNKTSNACSLIHEPTGIRVVCHETRSRETNRKLARRIMRERLDQHFSPPGESRRDLEAERERKKKEAKRRKSKRKAAASKATDQPLEQSPNGQSDS
ncbi:hypothetical protein JCM3766R1_006768 [Sporobolomyces carnicolor]